MSPFTKEFLKNVELIKNQENEQIKIRLLDEGDNRKDFFNIMIHDRHILLSKELWVFTIEESSYNMLLDKGIKMKKL